MGFLYSHFISGLGEYSICPCRMNKKKMEQNVSDTLCFEPYNFYIQHALKNSYPSAMNLQETFINKRNKKLLTIFVQIIA